MLRRRFGTFSGGIDLPDEKDATLDAPIAPAGRLERLAVPLEPISAAPAEPVVHPSQRVQRGQLLAKAADGEQVDVFAPLGGRVGGPVQVMLTDDQAGWRRTAALELVELDDPAGIGPLPNRYDWQSRDGDAIRQRIAEGQLLTCRAKPRPLASFKMSCTRTITRGMGWRRSMCMEQV